METGNISVCAVFGCVDGKKDENGDIIAQDFKEEDIPTEAEYTRYIGPSVSLVEVTKYERIDDLSLFTMSLARAAQLAVSDSENTPVIIDQTGEGAKAILAEDVIVIDSISTPGGIMHYKHKGSDPEWPIVSTFGGSEGTAFNNGNFIISSGAGPLPNIKYTGKTEPSEEDYGAAKGLFNIYINLSSITFAIQDMKAPLSQNRTVKFLWEDEEEGDDDE
jgi:hypothetical protein